MSRMEADFFFNNIDSNVFFWIRYMRRWDISDLINFWSSGRRSHSKETFFNSNWMCLRLCFFILNNFIRDNIGWYIWINNSCGVGCALQIAIMFRIMLAKGSIQFCPEILWVFNIFNKVPQAWRKGQKYGSKISITIIYPVILILIRLFTKSNRHLVEILSLDRLNHLQLPFWISCGWSNKTNW